MTFYFNPRSMKIALRIQPTHDWIHSVAVAHQWAHHWQAQGHEVVAVLFFGEAAQVINHNESCQQWRQWQQGALLVCSTVVEDRQIQALDDHPFQVAGLGLWESLTEQADQQVVIS